MQCELLGAVTAVSVEQLSDTLTGLSGRPGSPTHEREVVLKGLTSPFTELRLSQSLQTGGDADLNSRCFLFIQTSTKIRQPSGPLCSRWYMRV